SDHRAKGLKQSLINCASQTLDVLSLRVAQCLAQRGDSLVNRSCVTQFLPLNLSLLTHNVGDISRLAKLFFNLRGFCIEWAIRGEFNQYRIGRNCRLYGCKRDGKRPSAKFTASEADLSLEFFPPVFEHFDPVTILFNSHPLRPVEDEPGNL